MLAIRLSAGSLLCIDGSFLTHSSKNDDVGILALVGEELVDFVTNVTLGDLDIIFGRAIVGHKGEETVVGDIEKLVFLATNVGNVHVVGGGAEIFKLLASKDIDGNKMDLGVTVLASLGGGHFDDLAGAVLDDDETVLPQSRALHGVGGGGASIGALKGVLMLGVVVGHFGLERVW